MDWISKYREASSQTKYFILNWILYGILIIASTLYCYGRLDYVRTGRNITPPKEQAVPK
jgi:hypothetical protein